LHVYGQMQIVKRPYELLDSSQEPCVGLQTSKAWVGLV